MWHKFYILMMIHVLLYNSLSANVLFEETFTNESVAVARFDKTESLGWVASPVFHDGVVTLMEYSGGTTTIRTKAANNFVDDGVSGPVVYSVVMDRQDGTAGSVFNSLYARLGAGGFGDGYQVRYLCDSTADASYSYAYLDIFRVVGGVKTVLYSSGMVSLAPVTFAPTEMSLTLENQAGAVDWAVEFGSISVSGSDTDAARITSGVGVGVELMSSGGAYFIPTDYDNLKVEVIPEPATITLLVLGSLTLLSRKR